MKKIKKKLYFISQPAHLLVIASIVVNEDSENINELIVLNHFNGAEHYINIIKSLKLFDNVVFIDDANTINKVKEKSFLERVLFFNFNNNEIKKYKNIIDNQFDELYISTEFGLEYFFAKKFYKEGKNVILYEDGYANYVNVNKHKNLLYFFKNLAYVFNYPSSYLGSLKYIQEIRLSMPNKYVGKKRIQNKIDYKQPLNIFSFINNKKYQDILFKQYRLSDLRLELKNKKRISILLTSPNIGGSTKDNDLSVEYYKRIIDKMVYSKKYDLVILKKHPTEKFEIKTDLYENVIEIDQKIPVEMFFLIIDQNQIIDTYTFGSAAVINLHLYRKGKVNIFIIPHVYKEYNRIRKLFCKLCDQLRINYDIINI